MACIFFTPYFTAVYIVERLVLQTIYVLKRKKIFFGPKIRVYGNHRQGITELSFKNYFTLHEMTHSNAIEYAIKPL